MTGDTSPMEEALLKRARTLCVQFSQIYEDFCAHGEEEEDVEDMIESLDTCECRARALAVIGLKTCSPLVQQLLDETFEGMHRAIEELRKEWAES